MKAFFIPKKKGIFETYDRNKKHKKWNLKNYILP